MKTIFTFLMILANGYFVSQASPTTFDVPTFNIEVLEVSSSSIHLQWDAIEGVATYIITVTSSANDSNRSTPDAIFASKKEDFALAALVANQSYFVTISALDSNNVEIASGSIFISTLP